MLLPPVLLPAHAREHFVVVLCVCVCECMHVCVHVCVCLCVSPANYMERNVLISIVQADVILQPIYGLCDLMLFTTLILATHPSVLC